LSKATIYQGDALAVLRSLPAESVHCVVTSPPYFGLRDYGVPGQIGLESSIEEYVARLVEVFREVRRVLRSDGTLWLNLGDSYSSGGVGTNLLDCLQARIKGGVMLWAGGCTLTITAQSSDVLKANQVAPDGKLPTLLRPKRVLVKQRNNDFGQVLYSLQAVGGFRIVDAVGLVKVSETDAEIILDKSNHVRIIVSELDLDEQSPFRVPIALPTAENVQGSFAVEETGEPAAEGIVNRKTVRNPIPFNTAGKSVAEIDLVDETIAFRDAALPDAEGLCNLRVTEASEKHLSLLFMDGALELTVRGISHLFISNRFGSLIHYIELYYKAYRDANERQPKQEMGIPEMVKRALMRDGWVCRSTIVWAKPNPMPESVTDRPTNAHEYVFLFSKAEQYFYDSIAIAEPYATPPERRAKKTGLKPFAGQEAIRPRGNLECAPAERYFGNEGRNRRSVWTIATKPYRGAHFATFPPELPELCIKAGTSEKGCCPQCGTGWGRVVEKHGEASQNYAAIVGQAESAGVFGGANQSIAFKGSHSKLPPRTSETIGWRPVCACYPRVVEWQDLPARGRDESEEDYAERAAPIREIQRDLIAFWEPMRAANVPAIVLDPFGGAGTTGMVSARLLRDAILIELNPRYCSMAARRIKRDGGMFVEIERAEKAG
jgi:DNA modification methylase